MVGIFKWVCTLCLLVFWPMAVVCAADLTAYTEEWLPYSYTENHELKGISTDVLQAMCEQAKLTCDVREVPWARGYKTALETPDTMIYTTARIPSRENSFIWLGPILPRTTWIYATADKAASIRNFADLAAMRIGVVRAEASIAELRAVGVPPSSILQLSSTQDEMRLMKLGKIDVVVNTEIGMAWNLKKYAMPSDSVRKLMKLTDEGALYFALNAKSNPALASQLQHSIDELKREGKFDAIVLRYTGQKLQ